MPRNDGVITRRDVIEDEALNWGKEYADNVKQAIGANKELIEAVKTLNEQSAKIKSADTNKAFVEAKNAERLATQQAIDAIKKQEAAEISANKVKLSSIKVEEASRKAKEAAEKSELSLNKARERGVKLTLEEKIANQENLKNATLQAKATGALSSHYGTLNAQRTIAARNLANLLAAEKQEVAQVRIAQREYDVLDARIRAVDAATRNYSKNIGNYTSAFKGLNNVMSQLASTFGIVTGIALVGRVVRDIFTVIKEFDRQLIAVGKTTDIVGDDLKDLGEKVVALGGDLNGISIQGLLNTAEVAGQLGVKGTQNILAFSEAVEKLKLTSDIVSRDQVQNFAQFIEVSEDSFENADRLASVMTILGNNFATTEAAILSNATEIQKGVAVYNASAASVLGLGAATAALGAQAEASRSAVQLTFKAIDKAISTGEGLNKVLELTNLTQAELASQFRKDTSVVFLKFVEGLKNAGEEGKNLNNVLSEVGINQIRTTAVVGTLAANYEILRSALAQSSEEYRANIELNREVAAASESIASIINDVKDAWAQYIHEVNTANEGTKLITDTLKFLRDNLATIITNFLRYGSVLLTYLGILKLVTFATAAWVAISKAAVAAQVSFAVATGIGTKSILVQAAATRAATTAQTGFNAALAATPWGLILALIGAVVVAYKVFNSELSQSEKTMIQIQKNLANLNDAENYYNEESDKFRQGQFDAIEEEMALRQARGEDIIELDKEEIEKKKEVVQAQLDNYQTLKNTELERTRIEIEQSQDRIAQIKKELETRNTLAEDSQFTTDNLDAGIEAGDNVGEFLEQENAKLKIKRAVLIENSKITVTEVSKLNKIMQKLDLDFQITSAEQETEEREKANAAWLRARKKLLRELYEAEKKAQEDAFKLAQFRLQVEVDVNKRIVQDEKKSLDERLDAQEKANDTYSQKLKEALEFNLKMLGDYNEDTGKFTRELTDEEISEIVKGGKIKKDLTDEQRLLYEKYQESLTAVAREETKERQKIIDDEVEKIERLTNADVQLTTNEANKEIVKENDAFANEVQAAEGSYKLIQAARLKHEQILLEIQKKYALQGINLQIESLEKQLANNDAKDKGEQVSAEKRAEVVADLERFKREASDIDKNHYLTNLEDKQRAEEQFRQAVEELGKELAYALFDFGNALYDAKVQRLDDELARQKEYYDEQLSMVENDAVQKELIERQAEKDRKKIEAEKRKAQIQQAKMNKLFALADIAFNTAKAVMAVTSTGGGTFYADFGISTGILTALTLALGAAQAATVLATPIPKYKTGRKGGPEEHAWLGDGYIREVISDPDGKNPRFTPSKPTIMKLNENEKVHSSVREYNTFMRKTTKQHIQTTGQDMRDYSNNVSVINNSSKYDKNVLDELKRNTDAITKSKKNIIINMPKVDMDHKIWAYKNVNWN